MYSYLRFEISGVGATKITTLPFEAACIGEMEKSDVYTSVYNTEACGIQITGWFNKEKAEDLVIRTQKRYNGITVKLYKELGNHKREEIICYE